MATLKKSLKYSAAALVMAFVIIGTTLISNSIWVPPRVHGQTNFLVMLTDPPNVPKGTSKLEVTYSNIQLHVVASDGTANWIATQESGSVDLLSLVDIKQTIASVNLATGSTVDKLQFTLSLAEATINDVVYPVTILTDNLVVSLRGTKLNGTTTGALIDLRPTLVRINAFDSNGDKVNYYILVPSARAIIKSNVDEDHKQIGATSHLDDDENEELNEEHERTRSDLVITDATLSVNGNETTLSATLQNTGEEIARIGGLKVRGGFETNPEITLAAEEGDDEGNEVPIEEDGHDGIVFKISGNTLIPLLGGEDTERLGHSKREIEPGDTLTLNFSGVLTVTPHDEAAQIIVIPIKGNTYSIQPVGENTQTYDVIAS